MCLGCLVLGWLALTAAAPTQETCCWNPSWKLRARTSATGLIQRPETWVLQEPGVGGGALESKDGRKTRGLARARDSNCSHHSPTSPFKDPQAHRSADRLPEIPHPPGPLSAHSASAASFRLGQWFRDTLVAGVALRGGAAVRQDPEHPYH